MAEKETGKGVVKGAPSGFVVSLLVHIGAFLLAGLLVVFTVQNREEKKFVPPKPVDRPKMKLKKPKVKVKKTAKPKSTTRIVTKVKRADMPDIQLPEMSGMGEGLGGGLGSGFDIMPEFSEVTIFGSGMTDGNDFVGTFYDFKRDRTGRPIAMDKDTFIDKVSSFVRSGFKASNIARYYRSPRQLYATCFMVPTVRSTSAPQAFGEQGTGGWCWLAHYKGNLVHKDGIRFRFWGQGDDILIVRVDGKIVLNASWPGTEQQYCNWFCNDSKERNYRMGNNYSVPGDWIELEPCKPLKMEVLCGEVPGGHFDAMLCVEVEGVEYPLNRQNGPILPMFKTAEPSHDLCDAIYEWLVPGEASVTNGPVFSDFSYENAAVQQGDTQPSEPAPVVEANKMRLWTLSSGETVEAEYVISIGDKIVLKNSNGNQVKIPAADISREDREFVEISNPPQFSLDFIKRSSSVLSRYETSPSESDWQTEQPRVNDFNFGVRIKQTGARPYNHELSVEYFAFGQQYLDDSKFILFDRDSKSFTPNRENKRMMEFLGKQTVETINYNMHDQARGEKYMGYLILVRDKRGEIIQWAASNDWLYEKHDKIASIPMGRYFDKTGNRVYPTGPRPIDY